MWKFRLYRWRNRILLPLASLPLFQMTGSCDPTGIQDEFNAQVGASLFGLIVNSARQTLLQSFPSADLLQLMFGNPPPFFTG